MTDFTSKKPFFVLAPMDDVTDTVFRQIVASNAAPDLFVTEFVNVDALQSAGRQSALKRLRFTPTEKPLIAQIWGKTPENYYKTAYEIASGKMANDANGGHDAGNYVGIDINMGCPEKNVVKSGSCSALMNNRELAVEVIQAVKQAIKDAGNEDMFVSVKTRLGFNEIDYSWHELLLDQKLNMLTIHGRTRKEMSKVPANWEAIGHVRELRDQKMVNTLIIGNGDVESRQQGQELAEKYGLDGIMIGRGIFHDPFVFAESSTWPDYTPEQRISLYRKHVQLFADTWKEGERPVATLNKFCKVYIQNFEGAKELREKLMAAKSTNELLTILG